jgi:putative YjhG/YagF family dehydratase
MKLPDFLTVSPDDIYNQPTSASGPGGSLPLTADEMRTWSSGDIFGLTQDSGMGMTPALMKQDQVMVLTTMGGLKFADGRPAAYGLHTGHWQIDSMVLSLCERLGKLGLNAYACHVSDPCDGRTNGTMGMRDSLGYRNDAAATMARLARSLPKRKGIFGVGTCDKGFPAIMMALAGQHGYPAIAIPGGVTLPTKGAEDAGRVQSVSTRFAQGEISLQYANDMGCRACGTPGGGCQFLGTAASSQVCGESLGLCLPHSALSPSGFPVWFDIARRSGDAMKNMIANGIVVQDVITEDSIWNAMLVHAAFGASSNMLLHIPAIAFAAGVRRPTVEDWVRASMATKRIADTLPNGEHATVRAYLAGGVPEVMLHLRDAGLLKLNCMTVTGLTVEQNLEWWEKSQRRERFKQILQEQDGVDPEAVIMPHSKSKFSGTLAFPQGNLTPDGSVIKVTAVDPSLFTGDDYLHLGRARVFTSEATAMAAIKGTGGAENPPLEHGEIVVLIGIGPSGAGMPEIFQVTGALKYTTALKGTPVLTDARFSGVSTGPCVGHIGPEACENGPISRLQDGDWIQIRVSRVNGSGSIDLVGEASVPEGSSDLSPERGARILSQRLPFIPQGPNTSLPNEIQNWAMQVAVSGGTWGGCVYDPAALRAALAASRNQS